MIQDKGKEIPVFQMVNKAFSTLKIENDYVLQLCVSLVSLLEQSLYI
jgi:hypothetical protein